MRGEWIEIGIEGEDVVGLESLPMRGEWIEIIYHHFAELKVSVSPHAGRVD